MQRESSVLVCRVFVFLVLTLLFIPVVASAQDQGVQPSYPGHGPSQGKAEGAIGSFNVRFYGTFLLNTSFSDTPPIGGDVPLWAPPSSIRTSYPDGTSERVDDVHDLSFTARQSVFGLTVRPTATGDWQTSGKLEFDFFGTRPSDGTLTTGRVLNQPRLRFAYFQFGKNDWKITAGQDKAILAPLDPVSLSHVAIPLGSTAGNLWAWLPQVRFDYNKKFGETSAVFQFGVLRPQFADPRLESVVTSGTSIEGSPGLGERASHPFYQARIGLSRPMSNSNLRFGASGHYGRERIGADRTIDSWAFAVDFAVPVMEKLTWRGEAFVGSNLIPFQGGVQQGVAFAGAPSTTFNKIGAGGGWTELIFELNSKDVLYAGVGVDDPRDRHLLTGSTRSRNAFAWASYFRKLTDNVTIALEWSNWQFRTRSLTTGVAGAQGPSGTSNVFNLALAYQF